MNLHTLHILLCKHLQSEMQSDSDVVLQFIVTITITQSDVSVENGEVRNKVHMFLCTFATVTINLFLCDWIFVALHVVYSMNTCPSFHSCTIIPIH